MKLHEVMTTDDLRACHATATLAEAATMMWSAIAARFRLMKAGASSDRLPTDICIAVATRPKRASEIHVGEVVNILRAVHTCYTDDSLKTALKTMQRAQVRRLPVVDADGVLRGVVSISDVIRHAKKADAKKILLTLKALSTRDDLHDHADDEEHSEAKDDVPDSDVIQVFET